MRTARLAALSGIGLLQLVSCGGGMDSSNPCPSGNCTLPGRTVVKWMFDHYPEWQFPMDSCVDFGAGKVQVDMVDAAGGVTSKQDDCGAAQVTFEDLAPGAYTAYVTPLDFGGNPLVTGPASVTVMAGTTGNNTEATANVAWNTWIGTFSGTYLFRLSWAGMSCETAVPPIVTQTVKLEVNGQVVNAVTDDGQKLDGTDPKPCKKLTDNFPQSATMVPFGPATLTVQGIDADSHMRFTHTFDTFVGAGISNPTITYDVPPPPPDAGVDAM